MRVVSNDASLEMRLEELRTKRDELEQLIRAHEAVLAQRIRALGPGGPVGRDIPENIRAEQQWLARDQHDLRDIQIAIAAIERAMNDGSPSGPYRDGVGVAAVIRKGQLDRDELAASLRRKTQQLVERYIAADVPTLRRTSKSGLGFLIVTAAGVYAVVVLGWPWCLLALLPIGILVGAAVRELHGDFRARKSPQSLAEFDSTKAPAELDGERKALHVESQRLDELREEVAALERVWPEKELEDQRATTTKTEGS